MKKYIVLSAILATLAVPAFAQVSQSSAAIDVLINDFDFKGKTIETVNELVADVEDVASLVSVNTNANVNLLTITPAFIGQILVTPNSTNVFTEAGTGATNSFILRGALAFGLTTNDWAKFETDK